MSEPPRVALATCTFFPDGDPDDHGLPAALGGAEWVAWDDPSAEWDAYDLVVIRSTWDYQERRKAYVAWAARIGDRLVNPPDVIRWNTDKAYMHELAEAGLPVVATELVVPGADFAPPATRGEFVVKPTVSAGSRDTARFSPAEADRAAALVASIHASDRTAMIQPYLASVDARGETALLFFDGVYSHAIRKGPLLRPGAAPTSEVFAPEAIIAREATAAEREVAGRVVDWAAQRFGGALAYARVDLVEDAAGAPVVLELELAEPSLFFAHGDGALARFADAVLRRAPDR
jgi:glutathione synthase/RimK-type ligase-like ATP-grasp enzyme